MRWCVLPLLLLPGFAMAQEDDKGFLTNFLEDNLSGLGRTVTINGFAGALSSTATISEMTIADSQGVWITLRDVTIQWNRSAILRGAVEVEALTADEIVLDRAPAADADLPSPEASGFSLPELPVSVNIGRIAADRIVLGEAVLGTPLEGRLEASMQLAGGEGEASLQLQRTDGGPEGSVTLDAAYANATRALRLDLEAIEAADGIATTLLGIPGAPSVDLKIAGEGVLEDFVANVTLASDGQQRLTGQVELLGTEDGTQGFKADLAGDLAPLFAPDFEDFFGNEVALFAEGTRAPSGRLELPTFRLSTQALQLAGNLALAADGLPEQFALTGTLGQADGTPVLLPSSSPVATRIGSADLSLTYDASTDAGWSLKSVMQGLDRADFKAETVTLNGSGRITRGVPGTGNVLGGSLRFDALGLAPADPDLAAALGDRVNGDAKFFVQEGQPLRLPRFALSGEDYGVEASGLIGSVVQGFPLSGTATVRADDITRFAGLAERPLSGALQGEVRGGGTILAGSFDIVSTLVGADLTIGIAEADNLLRGTSRIGLSLKRDETGTELRNLDIAAQTLTANASGTIATAGSDIRADVDFADLSVLGGPYGGRLTGQARVTGTIDQATATLDANGEGLTVGVAEVDALMAGASRLSIEAGLSPDAVDLRRFNVTAATVNASATGRLATSGSDVTAKLDVSNLAALGGPYRGTLEAVANFQGTAQTGSVSLQGTGTNLGFGVAELDRVLAGRTEVSAALTLTDGIARLERALIRNPQVSASASGSPENLAVEARLANLSLILPDFPGPVTVSGTAAQAGSDYALNLTATGPGQIAARISGTVAASMATANLELAGSAQAGLANAFIRPRAISGPVRFDLNLNGPLALSSLSGRVGLAGGRLADPSLPFSLEGITASADLSGGQARVNVTSGLTSGGSVSGSGTIGLAAPYNADLQATLGRVTIRDPRLYQARMNGAVTVSGPLTGGATIAGRIDVIEADLRIPSTGLGTAGQLPDLVNVNEPADVRATRARAGLIAEDARGGAGTVRRPFGLDVLISAPNRVFIRGRGLDAELGGELRLGGTTANIVPSGGFDLIRGRLDILGKRLVLTQAQLRLEGNFNAAIDIIASTTSDGITASVRVSGRALAPDVSFESSPELPEEEVLARLLFERGLTQLSTLQIAQLAGAVANLAGKGGEGIVGRLRQGFGLDDLDFQSSEDGGSSLRAGKYLSQNLYTEIIVGDDGQSEIQLNLDISDSITLRTSTGGEGGAGLGIFLEKDY